MYAAVHFNIENISLVEQETKRNYTHDRASIRWSNDQETKHLSLKWSQMLMVREQKQQMATESNDSPTHLHFLHHSSALKSAQESSKFSMTASEAGKKGLPEAEIEGIMLWAVINNI